MGTKIQSDNNATTTANDNNKVLFGPLGKYAILGVFMVGIIITSVIMLNKQLGTAAEDVAAIKKELSESRVINTTPSNSVKQAIAADKENTQEAGTVELAQTKNDIDDKVTMSSDADVESAEQNTASVTEYAEPAVNKTEEVVAQQQTAQISIEPSESNEIKSAKVTLPANEMPEAQQRDIVIESRDQQWEDHLLARKQEHKQRLAEFFDRIKSSEFERLEDYKDYQARQIENLREQIARQQKQIEELIERNKESYELREAKIQRYQADRDEILNRI
jgi:hypothetical protein